MDERGCSTCSDFEFVDGVWTSIASLPYPLTSVPLLGRLSKLVLDYFGLYTVEAVLASGVKYIFRTTGNDDD